MDSPFEVLAYQTYNNFIVASDEVIDAIRTAKTQPRAKMLRTKVTIIPNDWGFECVGSHNRLNAALAVQTAQLFKVDDDTARHFLNNWKSLKGRLELVKKVKGVEFFNDTMAMTPDATLAGVSTLSEGRNVILIFGGVDGGHEYRTLYSQLPRYVHTVIIVPGSGTLRQRVPLQNIEGLVVRSVPSIDEAVRTAFECAQKGDRVLFSPGFDAGGVEGSKIERGEKFVRAVRGL
jgi:UDP-N-acetylmuramoylalanine--D-glutamate ligase